jgi:hypothetical protein
VSPTGLRPNGLVLICRQHPPGPLALPDAMPTHRDQMVNRFDRGREQELRKEQGWTQLERGNKLGVPPVTVDTWMRGQHVSTEL